MTTEKILSAITKAIEQSPVPVGGVLCSSYCFTQGVVEMLTTNQMPTIKGTNVQAILTYDLDDHSFALLQLPITITE